MRILIIDDDKISRKKMHAIMEAFGECDEAVNGVGGMEAFQGAWEAHAPYDIITLDLEMEDMSGMEVLEKIRETEATMNLPQSKWTKIVMVTSHGEKERVIAAMAAKCDGYVLKPFSRETITKSLRKIFFKYVDKTFPDYYA